jgi:hypothetical protein
MKFNATKSYGVKSVIILTQQDQQAATCVLWALPQVVWKAISAWVKKWLAWNKPAQVI